MSKLCWFLVDSCITLVIICVGAINDIVLKRFNQFRYFTVITNILCWIYFLIKTIYVLKNKNNREYLTKRTPESRIESFLSYFGFVCTVSITLVGVVFWVLLAADYKWSWSFLCFLTVAFHLITPILKIIDYFAFSPNDIKQPPCYIWSLIYPFCYYWISVIVGITVDNWFPYNFLNPNILSWGMIIVYFCGLVLFYVLVIWLFLFIDKKIVSKRSHTLPLYSCLFNKQYNTITIY